jgi:exoribonuclease R
VTSAPLRLAASAIELADDFARVRAELDVPARLPPTVETEAATAAGRGPMVPPGVPDVPRRDARDLELITIDPPGSRDLDQAFHAERRGTGFRLHYAIADVAAFVLPGGAVDREAFARGETLYLPDGRAPLHPDVLGEGAASLLPNVDRPALLWTFDLDESGRAVHTRCERAIVRSRIAHSYAEAQARIDARDPPPSLALLRAIGERLLAQERERGGVSIAAPSQEVVREPDAGYSLRLEAPLPVESWNAQLSLLTGREAARIMDEGGVGLVRTLPSPDAGTVGRLRHTARALGIEWPSGAPYAEVVRDLRPTDRARATFLLQALHALRGAGYALVTPGVPTPQHAAVGARYAHVTAPLRRLADRFTNETVLALQGGYEVPDWVKDALPRLVDVMPGADRRAGAIERACIDAVEVAILTGHVGDTFRATVVDRPRRGVVALLADVPIVVTVTGDRPALGAEVELKLDALDPVARTSTFSLLPR